MTQTKEKQLVPVLRFKEFEGEWEKHTLKQLLSSLVDCEHKTAPYVDGSEYLVVRTNNVKGGKLVYDEIKYTTEDGFEKWTKRSVPEFGDVLFTREAPAGESCLVPEDKKVCLGQRMVLLKPDESKMAGQYLSSYLQSGSAIRDISNLSIGTTVTRINIADIYKLKCPVSSLPEQQKIASFLSAVDEKIQQLTQKKALLEQYKKGVMQQLFSGEMRFKQEDGNDYPDWEEKFLGDMTERSICYGVVQPGIKDDNGVKFIRGGDVFNGEISKNLRVISKTITDKYKRTYLKGGELIMSLVGYPGETAIVPIELAGANLARQVGLIDLKNDINTGYIHFYINSQFGKKNLLNKTIGSAQQVINIVDLKKLKVPLASLPEQQKIATYLSSIDTKIESITHQITQTQIFKKGLLQKMFV